MPGPPNGSNAVAGLQARASEARVSEEPKTSGIREVQACLYAMMSEGWSVEVAGVARAPRIREASAAETGDLRAARASQPIDCLLLGTR